MKTRFSIRILCAFLMLPVVLLCCGFGQENGARARQEIIEELVVDYGSYGSESDARVEALLRELGAVDPDAALRWEEIMALWKTANTDLTVNDAVLPDGLADTDELCIVALGFQLNPDGTMRDELIERLRVVKACAEKYPNALIVCTGGGTAAANESATEAGRMAAWLIENGVAERDLHPRPSGGALPAGEGACDRVQRLPHRHRHPPV